MISVKHAKLFCCEDISLIENYNKAIVDNSQIWECHHRLEIQGDVLISMQELIEQGLYYSRPACELIFLTKSEHSKLHADNQQPSARLKNSIANSGSNNAMYGKHHTQESKKKMAEAKKGNTIWLGRKHTEESKKKMSESSKGQVVWNKGKKGIYSAESLKKMSDARKRYFEEKRQLKPQQKEK